MLFFGLIIYLVIDVGQCDTEQMNDAEQMNDTEQMIDNVITLTQDNFDMLTSNNIALVKFDSPFSRQFINTESMYKEVSEKVSNLSVVIAKIDIREEVELMHRFNITKIPSFKIFRYGKVYDYTGDMKGGAIVESIRRYLNAAVTELRTHAEFNNFLSKKEHRFIGFFPFLKKVMNYENGALLPKDIIDFGTMDQNDDYVLATQFFQTAEEVRNLYEFGFVSSNSLCSELGYSEFEVIAFRPTLLKNEFENDSYRFEGPPDHIHLKTFFKRRSESMVNLLSNHDDPRFLPDVRVYVYIYFDIDFSPTNNRIYAVKETKYWYTKILKVAKKFERMPNVVFYMAQAMQFQHHLNWLGLADNDNDINVGIWNKMKKYPLLGDFDDLEELVRDVLRGTAKAYIKSAKKPKKNKGPVKIVVAKTFNKIVHSKRKDVLITLTSSGCEACVTFAPILKTLGTMFKKEKHIVIASMDVSDNDISDEYSIAEFPSIYFVKKKQKDDPELYTGKKDVNSITRFLHDHATSPIITVPFPEDFSDDEDDEDDDFSDYDIQSKIKQEL